jgi:hypothetical protein
MAAGPPWLDATRAVLERWIGARAARFELSPLHGTSGCDAYEYAARGGTVHVHATDTVALARIEVEWTQRMDLSPQRTVAGVPFAIRALIPRIDDGVPAVIG